LVELLSQHFLVSEKEAKEYIDIYLETNVDELKSIIKKYGKTDKEVAVLMKSEKTK
jgi:dsDNA-binding SOS-regulon protein